MDKQDYQAIARSINKRLTREVPKPVLVYGRRLALANGFSLHELKEVGLEAAAAKDLGLPVDEHRMSSLGTNVENLRVFLKRRG